MVNNVKYGTFYVIVASALLTLPVTANSETPLELQSLCLKGDAQSCNELGVQYLWGKGVRKSERMAFSLFEAACKEGHAEGCTRFARLVEYGDGDEDENFTKALGLYIRGCTGQYPPACADLGVTFEEEPLNSPQSAYHFFELACGLGDKFSCDEAKRLSTSQSSD